jgi:cytochrome c peroxidase
MLRSIAILLISTSITLADDAATIGGQIFADTTLSNPAGQACISCHDPKHAFADPRPVSLSAVPGKRGTRNAPGLMYAALIPSFALDEMLNAEGQEVFFWEGGLFQDGRARDLFEQVQEPFFATHEMNISGPAALASGLRKSTYAEALKKWIGEAAWADDEKLNYHAYRALVEFLKEPQFRPFNAPIDDYLAGNEDSLTETEQRGLQIFKAHGQCIDCHFLTPAHWPQALLSDFGYDNIGAPSRGEKDPGLAGHTKDSEHLGQFRAPSLRNVTLTAPYFHNGSIATLREVMEFYNKRDLEPERWGPTDYPETVNHDDMGNLGLTDQQIDDLLSFMNALTDRHLIDNSTPPPVQSTEKLKLYFHDWTHRLHSAFKE